MKSASEWLDDLGEHCYSANDRGGFLGFEAVKVIRAIQTDALKAAAEVMTEHIEIQWSRIRAIDDPCEPLSFVHEAFASVLERAEKEILSLIPKEGE